MQLAVLAVVHLAITSYRQVLIWPGRQRAE